MKLARVTQTGEEYAETIMTGMTNFQAGLGKVRERKGRLSNRFIRLSGVNRLDALDVPTSEEIDDLKDDMGTI